jgi:hypothetical protein
MNGMRGEMEDMEKFSNHESYLFEKEMIGKVI